MIGLIQRVSEAETWVNGEKISSIGKGIVLLVGVAGDDGPGDVSYLVNKTVNMRIFSDEKGHLNR